MDQHQHIYHFQPFKNLSTTLERRSGYIKLSAYMERHPCTCRFLLNYAMATLYQPYGIAIGSIGKIQPVFGCVALATTQNHNPKTNSDLDFYCQLELYYNLDSISKNFTNNLCFSLENESTSFHSRCPSRIREETNVENRVFGHTKYTSASGQAPSSESYLGIQPQSVQCYLRPDERQPGC